MEERINRITAFLFGDLLITILTVNDISFYQESWHFVIKATLTLFLGALGGLGGLLIKDVYPHIKVWAKKQLDRW